MAPLEAAFDRLNTFVEQQMQIHNTPGLALAVTDRERLRHVATYGLADVAAQKPVTPETLFEIGSIGKSFTAIALLQLYAAGELDPHAPVTDYLSWFHVPAAGQHEPITLHHLLSHTAGIIMGTDFTTEARYEVWALRETEATTPPGATFHYSNVGYKALGLVLEERTGRPYGEIIRQRILEPIGMAATTPIITHEVRPCMAVGYEPMYDDRPYHRHLPLAPAPWFETATADGSIAADAADMAAYVRMLMNHGQVPHGRVLSEEGFRLVTQRVIRPSAPEGVPDSFYGYGLDIRDDGGHTLIGHGGGMVGYYSAILADLDDGLGVVVLINGPGEPGDLARFALKLLGAAHRGEELPPLPAGADPGCIEKAAEYTGQYSAGDGAFTLEARGEGLIMYRSGRSLSLEARGKDAFYVPDPDFERFVLRFGREDGKVVEASHGPDWYVTPAYSGPVTFDHPPAWQAYSGHYRAHNPWHTNFRVVLRKGSLLLIEPWGEERALAPLGDGLFRIGDDGGSPERLRFDTILDGQAIRANLSGCDYYRTFTP
jgi:D-alanyl-D-alanine carboxypeptidase